VPLFVFSNPCVARFWDRAPVRVDLVSAVHVADACYYRELQSRLARYDRVLYELVADKSRSPALPGQRWRPPPPPPRTPGSAKRAGKGLVGWVQRFTASTLQLSFQLEELDYSRANWYHADLDLQQFQRLQKQRGESLLALAAQMSAASLRAVRAALGPAPPGTPPGEAWRRRTRMVQSLLPIPLVAHLVLHGALCAAESAPLSRSPVAHALLNLDISSGLKMLLAEGMCADSVADSLLGEAAVHSVILGDRNAAAMVALTEALSSGAKSVAVFYGAAHLPDLERRLTGMGMRRTGTAWLPAWSISLPLPGQGVRINRTQSAALFGISLMLASDLYVWELVVRWAGEHLQLH